MIEFLIGSAVVTSGLIGVFWSTSKKEETDDPAVKHPVVKKMFRFFKSYKKGKTTYEKTRMFNCYKAGNVSVHIYDRSVDEIWVYMYVDYKRVFLIHYQLSEKKFLKFETEVSPLATNELKPFTDAFHTFMADVYQQNEKVDREISSINALTNELEEKENWQDLIPKMTLPHAKRALLRLKEQIDSVHPDESELDIEETHRLARLEKDILPELLEEFFRLSHEEQTKQEQALVASLSDATEKVEALVQKLAEKKALAFQKKMELLKQF